MEATAQCAAAVPVSIEAADPERAADAFAEVRAAELRDAARAEAAAEVGVNLLPIPRAAPAAELPTELYWGLDPLYDAHVEVLAKQLHAFPDATPNGDIVWMGNHPIRFASICGLVVRLDPKNPLPGVDGVDRPISFQLDDTTGTIDCARWWYGVPVERQRLELRWLRLGATLRAQGRLRSFRGRRQLTADDCWPELDPHAERLHWARARELWHTCYARPFRVPGWALDEAISAAGSNPVDGSMGASSPHTPRACAASPDLCAAVLEVVARADEPVTAASIAARLPAAAKARISPRPSGASPAIGTPAAPAASAHRVLREAVDDALRQLQEASAVYDVGRHGAGGVLWRALDPVE